MTRYRIPLTAAWGLRLALVTALISGVAVWLNAFAVRQVPDAALYTTLKNLVAAVILVGAAAGMGGLAEARRLDRSAWARLLLIGVVGGSIPFLLFFTGLAQATAPGAAFVHKTLFIWVALLAVPLLGERLGMVQAGALAVLIVGQLLLAPPRVDGAAWGAGESMILAATLLWAVEVVIARRILASVSPAVVGAARLGFGVLLLFGYLAVSGGLAGITALGAEAWAWVLITGVILAGYVGSWLAALRRAPAGAVTAVLVVGAVVTASLQAVAGSLVPTPQMLVGVGLLVMAVLVVARAAARGAARVGASGTADRGAAAPTAG